jgi:hypothetical protein
MRRSLILFHNVAAKILSISADIVERFCLGLMLFFVAFRNLIELSGSEFDFSEGMFLPKSFGWIGGSVLWTISYVGTPHNCIDLTYVSLCAASVDGYDLRDPRGLAQARLYHQVQPYSSICL